MNEELSGRPVSRRGFVCSTAAAISGFVFLPDRPESLKLAVVTPANRDRTSAHLLDGVRLGLSEAQRAASLFGRESMNLASRDEAQVLIASVGPEACRSIAEQCDREKKILIDCGSRANALRREVCSRFVFHVEASEAMYADAQKQAPGRSVTLWTASLEKYGASQLNDRFRSAAGYPMDSLAWTGWLAVKIVWESYLRLSSSDTSMIAQRIASGEFDGHKGAQLSFRAWDHQLRQPLYSVQAADPHDLPREIPDAAEARGTTRELLDTLGDSARETECRMASQR